MDEYRRREPALSEIASRRGPWVLFACSKTVDSSLTLAAQARLRVARNDNDERGMHAKWQMLHLEDFHSTATAMSLRLKVHSASNQKATASAEAHISRLQGAGLCRWKDEVVIC